MPARVQFDPSGANVMGIGAYQDDAMQHIYGAIDIRMTAGQTADSKTVTVDYTGDTGVISYHDVSAAKGYHTISRNPANYPTGSQRIIIDSSKTTRTSSETRGKATRFALRLAAC